jgi:hypothetical protein
MLKLEPLKRLVVGGDKLKIVGGTLPIFPNEEDVKSEVIDVLKEIGKIVDVVCVAMSYTNIVSAMDCDFITNELKKTVVE